MVAFTSLNPLTMPSSSSSLTKKEKQALKLFKKELQKAFPNQLHSLKLFGSKARGDAAKHSDIDVLVILRNSRWQNRYRIHRVSTNVLLQTGVLLSVKVFSPREVSLMKRRRSAFWQTIASDLKEI
jgi:predicted nucleotidyltransferase